MASRKASLVSNRATRRRVSSSGPSFQRLKNSPAVSAWRPRRVSRACLAAKMTAPMAPNNAKALTAVAIAVTCSAQFGMGWSSNPSGFVPHRSGTLGQGLLRVLQRLQAVLGAEVLGGGDRNKVGFERRE